jgi:putative transposase
VLGVWGQLRQEAPGGQVLDLTGCGIGHDRDLNAARNILVEGRMVAAGLAETLSARGGGIRGGLVPAAAREGRTHQGAA